LIDLLRVLRHMNLPMPASLVLRMLLRLVITIIKCEKTDLNSNLSVMILLISANMHPITRISVLYNLIKTFVHGADLIIQIRQWALVLLISAMQSSVLLETNLAIILLLLNISSTLIKHL